MISGAAAAALFCMRFLMPERRCTGAQIHMATPVFKRILLKLSGEALAANQGFGVDPVRIHEIAEELADVKTLGMEIAIVVGGGNFFRGVAEQAKEMDRVSADQMGMLATVINALALQGALEKQGVFTRVMSAIEMNQVAEPFIRRRAIRHLEKGRLVIFAGGTGNPYFSTDTAASLRAMEIKADVILKATKVDGIYDADPMMVKDAKKFDRDQLHGSSEAGTEGHGLRPPSPCARTIICPSLFSISTSGVTFAKW